MRLAIGEHSLGYVSCGRVDLLPIHLNIEILSRIKSSANSQSVPTDLPLLAVLHENICRNERADRREQRTPQSR